MECGHQDIYKTKTSSLYETKTFPPCPNKIGESTIRRMTRLSNKYKAVNLSQGFPNEPPPLSVRLALAHAVLTGKPSSFNGNQDEMITNLKNEMLQMCETPETTFDVLNQYSPPMGRLDLRQSISNNYKSIYSYIIDPETEITVTLGATEAFASALRTVGKPGDRVVLFEPFHELYPSQCKIFYLEPIYVTLREYMTSKKGRRAASWTFDVSELDSALSSASILVLNSPHNPTGKVFTYEELSIIVSLCLQYNVTIITDEIYEHMTYNPNKPHIILPSQFPQIKNQIFMCNSIGKSASATGWRVGWCIHPSSYSDSYRGIHDQMVVMSPHPMQYAAINYFNHTPPSYFEELHTRYENRLKVLGNTLSEVGFDVPSLVEGAYYWFVRYTNVPVLNSLPTSMDVALFMIKKVGVACVPGSNFYGTNQENDHYLRFAACRSLSEIDEACRRIRKVLGFEMTWEKDSKKVFDYALCSGTDDLCHLS